MWNVKLRFSGDALMWKSSIVSANIAFAIFRVNIVLSPYLISLTVYIGLHVINIQWLLLYFFHIIHKLLIYFLHWSCTMSWGSSVSIVSDYRQDDRGSTLAEAKNFSSSLCVQTSTETHPASYPMGTGAPFPGVKCSRGVTLTTHPHLELRSRMSGSYTSWPPWRVHGIVGVLLLFYWSHVVKAWMLFLSWSCGL
jgi:hypothetical protein